MVTPCHTRLYEVRVLEMWQFHRHGARTDSLLVDSHISFLGQMLRYAQHDTKKTLCRLVLFMFFLEHLFSLVALLGEDGYLGIEVGAW